MATQSVVFVSYCLTALAVQAFAQQRSVPPAFARPSQGRFSAAADLEPEQPVPQPFRRVSLPLYRGRGFGKTAAEGPAQQTFQSSTASAPVEGNGFVRDGGLAVTEVQPPTRLQGPPLYLQQQQQQQPERNQLQLQADRISQLQQQQQSAVDRAEDREVASVQQQPTDRVQLQPENPFRPLQVPVVDREDRIQLQQPQVDSSVQQQQPQKSFPGFRPQLSVSDRADRIQQQQADRVIQQQQVDRAVQKQQAKPFRPQLSILDRADRIQQQQVDRVQKQPEKPFPSFRPQPQLLQPSVDQQPQVAVQRRVAQKPWQKRVQAAEEIAPVESAATPDAAQRSKLERTESAAKQRAKKPVSQVLKKYRDNNADGSITWGFENDDGTFQEETIGVDCVTRGKYGYVDPEGVKREYSYSTGVPCSGDKDRPSSGLEAQASDAYGYIDYARNQYVMANGQTVDLNGMAKNRARKPVAAGQAKRKAAAGPAQ